mmetsp:Transcript_20170/g.47365  ORF Transcript_20170/g.47365 Transcript_20170/m.47365 type:complete len:246 (+) Transcript_20170:168-905(+)
MRRFEIAKFLSLFIACGFYGRKSIALSSRCQKPRANKLIGSLQNSKPRAEMNRLTIRTLIILSSSQDPNMNDEEFEASNASSGGPSMSLPTSSAQKQQPETPTAYVPPPPTPTQNSPRMVAQQRMDPLMASLTRDDSNASPDQPTQNMPLFGEIPADGTLLLLAPAAAFSVLGLIYSIVIAFNSSDQIVSSVMQAGDSIAQTAVNKNNKVYDKSVCRGLCSSQQEDLDGMRNFMEAITRNAREAK